MFIQSPEDLIIYKLRYYQISEQPKHMRDIKSILEVMSSELDHPYLEYWIAYFNLSGAWQMAQNWSAAPR